MCVHSGCEHSPGRFGHVNVRERVRCERERVRCIRERVPGLICAASPHVPMGALGVADMYRVSPDYIPVSTLPGLFPLASATCFMREVPLAP